nr:MAG TPA: hypothetical protein [Inoviridae sp.]
MYTKNSDFSTEYRTKVRVLQNSRTSPSVF